MYERLIYGFVFVVVLSCFFQSSYSQDKIQLIGGKVLIGKVLSVSTDTVKYKPEKKSKEIILESERVFSILYDNKKEEVIYKQDSLIGNFYSEEDMRMFVYGKQDAWSGYKPKLIPLVGFIVSGVGSYLAGNSIVVLGVPFLSYFGTMLFTIPSIDVNTVRDKNLLENDPYIDGYSVVARIKKNNMSLIGSVAGTAVGSSTYFITK